MSLMDDFLLHYGTKEHSGRYPFGSGNRPYQHGIPLVNPGKTVGQDIISGIKKGVNIAAPLYVIGKTGLGIMAVKGMISGLGLSDSVLKQAISKINVMSPKEVIGHIKTFVKEGTLATKTIPPEEILNLSKEVAENYVELVK